MRDLLKKHAYLIAALALVITILLVTFRGGGSATTATNGVKHFYVDDETGEETVLASDQLPPLPGKDGRPTLVKAFKFTADGEKNVVTAYLQKYSDEAIEKLKNMADDDLLKRDLLDNGRMIRLPGTGQKWVPINSPAGEKLRENISIPGGGRLEAVYPK